MSEVKRLTHHSVSGIIENLEYTSLKWDKIFDDVVLRLEDGDRRHVVPLRNISRLTYRQSHVEPAAAEDKKGEGKK